MKKNGFTLIELIGTLLLLGLLFVFITSNVISSIEDSKKAAANASTENLIDALEQYYYERKMAGTFEPCSYDFNTNINTCEGFIFDGKKPSRGVVSIDLDGAVSGNVDFGYYVATISDGSIIIPGDSESNDEYIGTEYAFNYTGSEKTFTVPYSGYYKLEVWGAQGGSISGYEGGYGGYSKGSIYLEKNQVLYINVGGAGIGATSAGQSLDGGYNGGGSVIGRSYNHINGSGGGATHIATVSGKLSTLGSNISSIIMVAGGGGGARDQSNHVSAARWGKGGSGGGYHSSGAYSNFNTTTSTQQSTCIATQNSGYAFGVGKDGDGNSAGGGGFYGGYNGNGESDTTICGYLGSGSGGSGYIGNGSLNDKAMYCYQCGESNAADTRTISTENASENPISEYAKKGNGYAKITYIGTDTVYTFSYTGSEQNFTAPYQGKYKIETWGAQGGSYDTTYIGGYGGYSVGTVSLNASDVLYVNVGGAGSSGLVMKAGGYNGGGISYGGNCNGGTERYGASGGGATHVAWSSGVLSSFDTNNNGLADVGEVDPILIVAGGGGGSHKMVRAYGSGGSAGGYTGNVSTWTNSGHNYYVQPTGGTQTSGGLKGYSYGEVTRTSARFGKGLDYDSSGDTCDCGSGGGGGFYGGGSGQFAPGGGGSGYIGNSLLSNKIMYCYDCTESNDANTRTVSTTGSNDARDTVNCSSGVSSSPISKCAKIGNGYVKITYLGQ